MANLIKGSGGGGKEKNYPGYLVMQGVYGAINMGGTYTFNFPSGIIPLIITVSGYSPNSVGGSSVTIENLLVYANRREGGSSSGTFNADYDCEKRHSDYLTKKSYVIKSVDVSANNISCTKWLIPDTSIPADGRIYLYKAGVINTDLTGGLTLVNVTNANGQLNFPTNAQGTITTMKAIDMAGYRVGYDYVNGYVNGAQYFSFGNDKFSVVWSSLAKIYASATRGNTALIDTGSVPYKLRWLNSYGVAGDCIRNIWLERITS